MNKRNKLLLIGLILFCASALAIGIYFFPDAGTLLSLKKEVVSPKSIPPPSASHADTVKAAPPDAAPASTSAAESQSEPKTSKDNPYISYPKEIVELLGIDMDDLLANQNQFENTIIHVEWMDHVNEVLSNLSPEKKNAIIKNHTALLYIRDKLNEAYLTGKIDHETFKKAIADLMKWHQRTYEAILTKAEYEDLFDLSPDQADDTIDAIIDQTPEYSFILNQNIGTDEVKEKVQGYKLEEVDSHFKKMILDRDSIGKQVNAGQMTLEQARAALYKSQQAFIAKCKVILTEDEINTIFGSMAALESGASQTEQPAVLGDTDKTELGFEIRNPKTSIETVKNKIDPAKLEDLKFYYQQRETEREELIDRLNKGEITSEDVDNTSRDMDTAYDENCRATLTDEEYQLIFSNPDTKNTQEAIPTDSK